MLYRITWYKHEVIITGQTKEIMQYTNRPCTIQHDSDILFKGRNGVPPRLSYFPPTVPLNLARRLFPTRITVLVMQNSKNITIIIPMSKLQGPQSASLISASTSTTEADDSLSVHWITKVDLWKLKRIPVSNGISNSIRHGHFFLIKGGDEANLSF